MYTMAEFPPSRQPTNLVRSRCMVTPSPSRTVRDASAVNEDAVKDSVVLAMLNAMGASDGAWKNI
jgi:hypothetical protein